MLDQLGVFWRRYYPDIIGWSVGIILMMVFIIGGEKGSAFQKTVTGYTNHREKIQIIQVFDGDTFSAKINGVTEKIRILGVDTPEVGGGYKQAECYGENASAFAKKTMAGKSVTLIPSQTGDDTDQYGRYLRYVEIDGKDFGKILLEEGYAQSYKKFPHDRKSEYNSTEQKAKSAQKGLWGKCKQ